jgi:hypothetical protein
MTTRDRREPSDELAQGAAVLPRSRLLKIGATLAVLVLSALGLSQCSWVQKVRLDREVDRLCAIDGGVRIYETVKLPKEDFGPDGEVFPQYRTLRSSDAPYGPGYQSDIKSETLVAGDPSLTRTVWRIVRRQDMKVLAEVVYYNRAGGDLPSPSAPSGRTCPGRSDDLNIERRVFIRLEH